MTTALYPYPKPQPPRRARHLRPLDPWDAPHTLEERADYDVQPAKIWVSQNYDRRAYRTVRRRVTLSDTERVVLDVVEDLTIHSAAFRANISHSAEVIARLAYRPTSSVERALTSLKKRNILVAVKGRKFPYNEPDMIGINPDFAAWGNGATLPDSHTMEQPQTEPPSMELSEVTIPSRVMDSAPMETPKPTTILKNPDDLREDQRKESLSCAPKTKINQPQPTTRPVTPCPKPDPMGCSLEPAIARWVQRSKQAYPNGDGSIPTRIRNALVIESQTRGNTDELLVALVDLAWDAHALPDGNPAKLKGSPTTWGSWLDNRLNEYRGLGIPLTLEAYCQNFRPPAPRHDMPVAQRSRARREPQYASGDVAEWDFALADGRRVMI